MLLARETTCVELLIVFGEVALTEGHQLNLITASLVRQAYHKALAMDLEIQKGLAGNSVFYGLPISIKDNVIKAGTDCTLGCASYVNQPHS